MPAASDALRAQQAALDDRLQDAIRRVGEPLEAELQANHLALVPVQAGSTVQPALLPVIDGTPVSPERFRALRVQGAIDDAEAERLYTQIAAFGKRVAELGERIAAIQNTHRTDVQQLYEQEARWILQSQVQPITEEFPQPAAGSFLADIIEDVVTRRLHTLAEDTTFTRLYRLNVILPHAPDEACPMVIESAPTMTNLLGVVEREFLAGGMVHSDHLMMHAGSLLHADGGFLILETRDVLAEPGAWKVLVRTLRTGRLEIIPSEVATWGAGPLLKPEPIHVNIKVILLGDPALYYLLEAHDPDFAGLFKVLADFDTSMARDQQGMRAYAGFLTDVPLRQDLAMTGAIDQVGHIQPVGAVTEKIEGFFDTCQDLGLTGTQGVIMPQAKRGDLMLRPDVVTAYEEERFHVYAVETIQQALELLTGRLAGHRDPQGEYPEHTLLRLAMDQARHYWRMVAASPADRSGSVGE